MDTCLRAVAPAWACGSGELMARHSRGASSSHPIRCRARAVISLPPRSTPCSRRRVAKKQTLHFHAPYALFNKAQVVPGLVLQPLPQQVECTSLRCLTWWRAACLASSDYTFQTGSLIGTLLGRLLAVPAERQDARPSSRPLLGLCHRSASCAARFTCCRCSGWRLTTGERHGLLMLM